MTERTIVLVRHSKAARPDGVDDFDRALTHRGHADSGAVGAWLAHRGYAPDVVICSPARRTRQTWHGVALGMADAGSTASPKVRYEPPVYDGDEDDLLTAVRGAPASASTVLLIGHNPPVSTLSALLDPEADTDAEGLRTAGIAVHRFEGDWASLAAGSAALIESHTARG
jgi:phosphohistidine phosphatase